MISLVVNCWRVTISLKLSDFIVESYGKVMMKYVFVEKIVGPTISVGKDWFNDRTCKSHSFFPSFWNYSNINKLWNYLYVYLLFQFSWTNEYTYLIQIHRDPLSITCIDSTVSSKVRYNWTRTSDIHRLSWFVHDIFTLNCIVNNYKSLGQLKCISFDTFRHCFHGNPLKF